MLTPRFLGASVFGPRPPPTPPPPIAGSLVYYDNARTVLSEIISLTGSWAPGDSTAEIQADVTVLKAYVDNFGVMDRATVLAMPYWTQLLNTAPVPGGFWDATSAADMHQVAVNLWGVIWPMPLDPANSTHQTVPIRKTVPGPVQTLVPNPVTVVVTSPPSSPPAFPWNYVVIGALGFAGLFWLVEEKKIRIPGLRLNPLKRKRRKTQKARVVSGTKRRWHGRPHSRSRIQRFRSRREADRYIKTLAKRIPKGTLIVRVNNAVWTERGK